jgi:hypothetical protein
MTPVTALVIFAKHFSEHDSPTEAVDYDLAVDDYGINIRFKGTDCWGLINRTVGHARLDSLYPLSELSSISLDKDELETMLVFLSFKEIADFFWPEAKMIFSIDY